jgi:hypothetical protein
VIVHAKLQRVRKARRWFSAREEPGRITARFATMARRAGAAKKKKKKVQKRMQTG